MKKRGMNPKQAEEVRIRKGLDKGTKLRRQRVKKGLSQSELSAISGVPLKTLQRYEQSAMLVDNMKLKTIIALCVALDCKIDDIIESGELIAKYRTIQ